MNIFLLQLVTLYWYIIFVAFCFSDGFKLRTASKIIWFTFFFFATILVFVLKGEFDLSYILPAPTLLAIILCSMEKARAIKKQDSQQ
jgi:hypothetical protein